MQTLAELKNNLAQLKTMRDAALEDLGMALWEQSSMEVGQARVQLPDADAIRRKLEHLDSDIQDCDALIKALPRYLKKQQQKRAAKPPPKVDREAVARELCGKRRARTSSGS
jgi:hypothetical protein